MRLGSLKNHRQNLFGICAFALCTLYGMPLHQAKSAPPVPEKKPVPSKETNISSFNVLDLAAELLDFGSVPTPQKKPAFKSVHKSAATYPLIKKYEQQKTFEPLGNRDQSLYTEIFTLQKNGEMEAADEKMKQLSNPMLTGHILYQRYMHPTAYSSSFDELQNWLEVFGDHPHADKIYKLAQGKGSGTLKKPKERRGVARVHEPTMKKSKPYVSPKTRSQEQQKQVESFRKTTIRAIRAGDVEQALSALKSDGSLNILDRVEKDILLAEVSSAFMYRGHKDRALQIAQSVSDRSGVNVPKAAWVAGLMNWQQKRYSKAASSFEMAARSPYASGWTVASASYWAARSHMRVGNVKAVSSWLRRGKQYPRTFYGLISTRALGHDFGFNWQVPTFTREMHGILSSIPAGARAIGLAQVGHPERSQAELLGIKPKDKTQSEAFLAFAGYANLPGLAMRLASVSNADAEGRFYDAALYPIGPWKAGARTKVDEALVNAIIRQESRFDPAAESPSGAKGLMQLMPATAKYVADGEEVELDDPETNLELGQKYLTHLLSSSRVNSDLLSLLIAYNAGPGNLGKWKARWPNVDDPLLFIELLPSAETRAYVERVLSNYWIYRMRAGQDTPSLDAIAAGKPARYASAI